MTSKELQIRNSLLYLLPVISGNLIPFLTLPIFTRILTTADYGALALAQIYGTFVSGLANFGLLLIYERNFFEYRDQRGAARLFYSIMIFVILASCICLFATYLFKAPLAAWILRSSDQASLLFWATCSASVISLQAYFLAYFTNTENAKSVVWYSITGGILVAFISLFLVVHARAGVLGIVWGQLLGGLVILMFMGYRFLKRMPIEFSFLILKKSLRLSYPLTIRLLFKVIGNQFDKYMIALLGTIGGVGVYSIGQQISYVVFTYMTAIESVFRPQVYQKMFSLGEKGGQAVGAYLTPFLYVSIAVALLVSLFAEEVITMLTPASYHGAIDIVIVLSMLMGSHFFGKQPQLLYAKKTFLSSFLTLVVVVLNIAINIPFILTWGAIGAAWGALTAGIIANGIYFGVSQHYYRIGWEYKKIALIFLIFFGSSLLIIVSRFYMLDYFLRLIIKGVALLFYGYLGIRIQVLSVENFSILRHILHPGRLKENIQG